MASINIDLSNAYRKLSDKAVSDGRRSLANQAMADMNQYVPAREYILRNTASVDIDGGAINYTTPYAKAQFYGFVGKGRYPVKHYTTPGTGKRWDLKGKAAHMDDWKHAFTRGAGW